VDEQRLGALNLPDAGSRRELVSLLIGRTPASHVHERTAHPKADALRATVNEERTVEVL
jgi:nitrilase